MYYVQIVQFDELLFCLICLVYANILKSQLDTHNESSRADGTDVGASGICFHNNLSYINLPVKICIVSFK